MQTTKRILITFLVTALVLGAAAQGDPARTGGTLSFGLLSEPASLDPHVYAGDQTMVIKQLVYSTLVRFGNEGGQLVGDLASEWAVRDDRIYTFSLVEGATFHDGSPVTAEDVRFSLERIIAPDSSATRRANLSVIESMAVLDERTLELTLSTPNAAFLAFLGRPESAVVSKAFVEGGANLASEMMGSGPFRFDRYTQGVEFVLKRHDGYHVAGLPYLDAVRFVPIPDETTRVNSLLAGALHAAQFIPWPMMAQIDANPGFELFLHADAVMFLQFNVARPPLDDPMVRQAIAHAINRAGVIRAAFLGRGTPITGGVIPADHWAHNAELQGTYGYDPARARAMLAEAGAIGARITIDTYSLPFAVRTAEVVQNDLLAVGLEAEIIVSEWPTYLEKTTQRGEFQARVYGAGWRVPDLDFWTPFVGSGGEFAGPANFSDEELDALLVQGRATVSAEERKEIYRQVEARVLEVSPMAFISWRVNAWAASTAVQDLVLIPDPMGPLSGINLASVWLIE